MIIWNVNPGLERPTPWVVNLRTQPHAKVQIGRGATSMTTRPASDDELDRYCPRLTKVLTALVGARPEVRRIWREAFRSLAANLSTRV